MRKTIKSKQIIINGTVHLFIQ